MRALNLNSPAPYAQHAACPATGEDGTNAGGGSPDLSPSSTTSTLLTPSDLSPAKPLFELKLNSAYEVPSAPAINVPSVSSSSLLLDHTSPVKTRDYMLPSAHNLHTRVSAAQMPFGLPSSSLSYLDAYADAASPLLATQSLSDAALSQFMRRQDASLAQTMAWRQHPLYAPSDWFAEGDQSGFSLSGMVADPEALRASPPQVSVPTRQGPAVPHAHEVRSHDFHSHLVDTYMCLDP